MKAVTHTSASDVITISSCQWQLLKTRSHGNKTNGGEQQGRGQPLPRSRQRHSACAIGEWVYVFCGKDRTSALKDVWKYHIHHQTWEMVETRGVTLPLLQGHTAVVYKRLILVFGGTFNNNANDAQLWTFNTDLGHVREVWLEPGAAQPLCLRDHSAVIYNNLMYVYGGFKDSTGASKELWAFNIDEEEWTDLTHLSRHKPRGRYGHSAVVFNNAMWVFGGMAGLSPVTDFWKYSLSLHQWTKLKCLGFLPSVTGHSACVVHDQMVVVGGNVKGKPVNDVWSYRFDTNSWQKISNTGMPLPGLSYHICVSISPNISKQSSTDRTWSTPHLKPSANPFSHDCFVVRPQTSPSVLKESSPHHEGVKPDGREETQVMTLERLDSVSSDLGTHRSDPRIDVNLKEPLVSQSPEVTGFYDSCIPFSLRGCADTNHELQVLQNVSINSYDDQRPVLSGEIRSSRESLHKAVTVDLIDLSDSPVLKVSQRSRSSVSRLWNDLFIEDLEGADIGGLDELQISYPPKHPCLPTQLPAECGSGGVMMVQQRNDNHSLCPLKPKLHHQNYRASDTTHNQCQEIELTQLTFSSHQSEPHRSSFSALENSVHLHHTRQHRHLTHDDMSEKASHLSAEGKALSSIVFVERDQPPAEDTALPAESPSPISTKEDRNERDVDTHCSIEAETSFTNSRDPRPSGITVPEITVTHDHLGNTPVDDCLSGLPVDTRSRDTSDAGQGVGGRKKAAEDCTRDLLPVIEDPFLLVLGGRSVEQVNIYPKPIAVWKAIFI